MRYDYDNELDGREDATWEEYNPMFQSVDHEDIAKQFAEKMYHDCGLYELGEDWGNEDYAIVVKDENGVVKIFQIIIEYDPRFYAVEIERDDGDED